MPTFFLLLILIKVTAATPSTIPCPGYTDPSNFSSIPLSSRPNLERILLHGFSPKANTAPLPTTNAPGNPVHVHQGFVDRPFRAFNESFCAFRGAKPLQCSRNSFAGGGPLSATRFNSLLQNQVMVESAMANSLVHPLAGDFYNPSYIEWEAEVKKLILENCDTAQQSLVLNMNRIFAFTFSCSIDHYSECQQYHPDFLSDLSMLPIGDNFAPYLAFVDKWGHGGVEGFNFGVEHIALQVSSTENKPAATLYMGRAGGLSNNLTSGELYTVDDCQDPAPVNLRYRKWYQLLLEDPFFEEKANISNLEDIRGMFFQQYLAYDSLPAQVERLNLTDYPECPAEIPSDRPSETPHPTIIPTTAPHSTSDPTLLRSSPPSSLESDDTAEPTATDSASTSHFAPTIAALLTLITPVFWSVG